MQWTNEGGSKPYLLMFLKIVTEDEGIRLSLLGKACK
jgi:hypothetical protein